MVGTHRTPKCTAPVRRTLMPGVFVSRPIVARELYLAQPSMLSQYGILVEGAPLRSTAVDLIGVTHVSFRTTKGPTPLYPVFDGAALFHDVTLCSCEETDEGPDVHTLAMTVLAHAHSLRVQKLVVADGFDRVTLHGIDVLPADELLDDLREFMGYDPTVPTSLVYQHIFPFLDRARTNLLDASLFSRESH